MKRIFLGIFCILALTSGSTTQPEGSVDPIPEGCLSMEFMEPSDVSRSKRDQSGRIVAVITPINRTEFLLRKWSMAEFEKALSSTDKNTSLRVYLPGTVAWNYLKKYLVMEDEIWTFGVLDTGFVVIRNNTLFCMVITGHQM